LQRRANRKYEEVCQESCRGRGQEILGCESGILQWSQTGSTRKCVRDFAEKGKQEVGGSESGIMQRKQTVSTRKCAWNYEEDANKEVRGGDFETGNMLRRLMTSKISIHIPILECIVF
jgi:hypothetical protein